MDQKNARHPEPLAKDPRIFPADEKIQSQRVITAYIKEQPSWIARYCAGDSNKVAITSSATTLTVQ